MTRARRRRLPVLMALALTLTGGPSLSGLGGARLPPGFSVQVVATDLELPVAFAVLPDDRILIAEKSGLVRLLKNGIVEATPFIDLRTRVNDYWDRGLLGMAVDPNFVANGRVYFYYVWENDDTDHTGPKTARLTRVTAIGDTAALASETVLVGTQGGAGCSALPAGSDCIPADSPSHNGGGLYVATDGTIYLSTGDGSSFHLVDPRALRAQQLDSLAGKLLHVTATGRGVATNPHWTGNGAANRSKVLAYGFRNPFRLTLRESNGALFVGDVGWEHWDEIDVVTPAGGNYGWPCYEGHDVQAGYAALAGCQALYAQGAAAVVWPLHAAPHDGQSMSIVAGGFVSTTQYPAAYQDAFFFADYARGVIGTLKLDAENRLVAAAPFATSAGSPVDLHPGLDGALYYLDIAAGELRRISYAPVGGSTTVPPSAMAWYGEVNGWGPPERDRSNGERGLADGAPITLNGQVYPTGIGVHAPSELRFHLGGTCSTFTSDVGVDDEVGAAGAVVFQVWADGTKLYDSGTVTGTTAALTVPIDVTGYRELTLIVTDGGDGADNDHADWAGARLECFGTADGLFVPATTLAAGRNTHAVAAADLNGDGFLDLVAVNAADHTVSVWPGHGDGTFGTRADFATGDTPKQVTIADVNNDGAPDLVSANQGAGTVSVLLGTGDGTFAPPAGFAACGGAHESAAGDFNGDGRLDVIVACWAGSLVSVLIGRGDGTFASPVNYASGANPHSVVVADLDADGNLDAVVANHGSGDVSVLQGRGDGAFLTQLRYPVGAQPHSIRAADLDGDGAIDVVTANEGSDSLSVLRGNGAGVFAAAVHYPTGRTPKGVAIADLDGDGTPDVVTANTAGSYPTCCQPGGDTISVRLGAGGGAFGPLQSYTVGLTPFSVAAADFDGDGDLDLATANWHSNDVAVLVNLSAGASPPLITDVTASEIGASTATIRWTTSRFTDRQVEYGTTSAYGQATAVSPTLALAHAVTLSGLVPDTVYHVRVRSRAAEGQLAVSPDLTLTTPASGVTNVTYLSDLSWSSMINGWGPAERDRSNGEAAAADGGTLTLAGVTYAKGLGTHAGSDLRYAVPPFCTEFRATVGVDDEVGDRGSVTFAVSADGVALFTSARLSGAGAGVDITVAVGGRNEVRLAVGDGGDGIGYDHADWADARFVCAAPGGESGLSYLSDLHWNAMTNGWGPVERDRSNGEAAAADGATLSLAGQLYAKGLGAHAPSDIRYTIPAGCSEFRATVGVDDEVGSLGSTTFTVSADGVPLFTSARLLGESAPVAVAVDVSGRRELRLVVGDGGDGVDHDHADWASARFVCAANRPPVATITGPSADLQYEVGQVIAFAGTGVDPEDGGLAGGRMAWAVTLHHCPGDCHAHPFAAGTGEAGRFTVPDHGDDNYFEIALRVTDSSGLSGEARVTIRPRTVQVVIDTVPAGLHVVHGGVTAPAPLTRSSVVGSTHTIGAPSPQGGRVFHSWSDGGAQHHVIVVGSAPATYVATYTAAPAVAGVTSDTGPPGRRR